MQENNIHDNDEIISLLKEEIQKIEKELGTAPIMTMKTNGTLYYGTDKPYVLHVMGKANIVGLLSKILRDTSATVDAVEMLGLEYEPPMIGGCSLEDWVHDMKQCINRIEWNTKAHECDLLKDKLSELMSEKARVKESLDTIASQIDKPRSK